MHGAHGEPISRPCAGARPGRRGGARATGSPRAAADWKSCRYVQNSRKSGAREQGHRPLCENRSVHIGRPFIRGFRSLVFAAVCVLVSAGLHFAAGGAPVSWSACVAAVAAVAPLAYLLSGTQRGTAAILLACATAQAGLHVGFSAGAGHLEHVMPSPAMLLVHALATAVCAVWLARGDAALAVFLDLLILWSAAALVLRLFDSGPVRTRRALAHREHMPPPVLRLLATVASRRGPPAPACSA